MWPSSVVYPPEEHAHEDATATATMIPVSHLAREGFTPAAMGMVLCNDSNIESFVQMVQGFHAEGVVRYLWNLCGFLADTQAFHLSTPNRLPIVFLPAKFDTNDPLQRLGVAFMTKPGMTNPHTGPPPNTARSDHDTADALAAIGKAPDPDGPKKKKRRQSAPAGTLPIPKPTSGRHKKGDSVKSENERPAAIEEEAVEKIS
jgi:hypothetical protein